MRDRGDLAHAAFFAKPGTVITFVVERDGKKVSVPIKVEMRRQVIVDQEESQIAEVDGALPDDPHPQTAVHHLKIISVILPKAEFF